MTLSSIPNSAHCTSSCVKVVCVDNFTQKIAQNAAEINTKLLSPRKGIRGPLHLHASDFYFCACEWSSLALLLNIQICDIFPVHLRRNSHSGLGYLLCAGIIICIA